MELGPGANGFEVGEAVWTNSAGYELWEFYVRELRLLGLIMSGMTVGEFTSAVAWMNAQPPLVSVGRVLGFADADAAPATLESGRLPRLDGGTVGRLVLRP